jgi:hypothetical protein
MSLATTFLTKVTIAEHGGLVRQIAGKLHGASISNEMFTQRLSDVDSTSQAEDEAYTHSQKDFNSNRLKEEDGIVDKLVKAVRAILNGYAELPEDEPNHQKGVELAQVFKDYNFSPSDTYTAEAEKIRNMNQVFQARIADLQALGVADYWAKAVTHAANMEQLLSQRFDDIAARVVGEVKTARANTDNAIKAMYELLAAMKVMMPSAELDNLISQLDAIEAYAWQYYLNGKGGSNGTGTGTTTPTNPENPGTTDPENPGTTDPTNPDTPSDPGTGGGSNDNPGGGSGGGSSEVEEG